MKQQLLQQQLVQYEIGEHLTLSNATSISAILKSSKSATSNNEASQRATLIQCNIRKSKIN